MPASGKRPQLSWFLGWIWRRVPGLGSGRGSPAWFWMRVPGPISGRWSLAPDLGEGSPARIGTRVPGPVLLGSGLLGAFLPLCPLGGLPCLYPSQFLVLFLPSDPGLPRGPWLSSHSPHGAGV